MLVKCVCCVKVFVCASVVTCVLLFLINALAVVKRVGGITLMVLEAKFTLRTKKMMNELPEGRT